MCYFFDANEEEQLTVTHLASKMKEFLTEPENESFCNQYLKEKLIKRYGDSIFISDDQGICGIVAFREKTSEILRKHFSMTHINDEESQKKSYH